MKSFPVYEFRTRTGVDYRIATLNSARHTSKFVGHITGETKADAIKKLQLELRLTVSGFVKGISRL